MTPSTKFGRVRNPGHGVPALDLLDPLDIDAVFLAAEDEAQVLLGPGHCIRLSAFIVASMPF